MRRWSVLVVAALLGSLSCETGRRSAAGFRLPADGDVERGKAAFVASGCNSCHNVTGADVAQPVVRLGEPVVLGGQRTRLPTDGYLVASIIAPRAKRMPDFSEKLTVRQVTDIVAFLQANYHRPPAPSRFGYY